MKNACCIDGCLIFTKKYFMWYDQDILVDAGYVCSRHQVELALFGFYLEIRDIA